MVNRMDNMMASQKVHGQDTSASEHSSPPVASTSTSHFERRGHRYQDTPTQDLNISKMVQRRVEQRLRQVPLVDEATSYEDSSSDKEQATT